MKFTVLALLLSQVWAAPQAKRSSNFLWLGSNESGAEFGQANIPGVLGTDYIWPDASKIQVLVNAGMNIFRVPFMMERLIPTSLTGTADATYLADLKATIESITSLGAYAVVDPHNFGRYYGNIITSTSDFAAFWTTVAKVFASNDHVIFDTNNEYHDEDQTLVFNLNQAAINAIRAAGATSQYIFVEGNSYSGAWTWTTYNTNLVNLTDPSDKIIYEMHQYLDSDGSGTSADCVSTTIGAERVAAATTWLRQNGKRAVLGEFAGGANSQCLTAVKGMLDALSAASDVWLGALWWSAGPWWGTYIFNMEPTTGTAYTYYLSLLQSYVPGGSSGTTTTTTAVATTTTTKASTTSTATTTKASTTSTATTTKTTTSTKTTTAATSTSTAVAPLYGQCGGIGWTGATTCASGSTCIKQNDYYSQCL